MICFAYIVRSSPSVRKHLRISGLFLWHVIAIRGVNLVVPFFLRHTETTKLVYHALPVDLKSLSYEEGQEVFMSCSKCRDVQVSPDHILS